MNELDRPYHEVSSLFPLMDGAEYELLKADIAKNGLLEAIWLHPNGSIIDGRNRHRACIETGAPMRFRTWGKSGSLVSFVVSLNLHRRHMSSSQRAVIALDVLPMLEKEAIERMRAASRTEWGGNISTPLPEQGKARDQAASLFDTNPRYVSDAKKLAETAPELLEEVRQGNMTIPQAKRKARKEEIREEREQIAAKAKAVPESDKWHVWQADMETWNAPRRYDFIITDPPYPKEYLRFYEVLAVRANEWLVPGGLLVAMCGQSYLDQIYEMMGRHLTYYWTACYLTPGQPTPLRQRQVNTTWKPLLIYSTGDYKGKIFGDVFKSDGNDKSCHKWGQSISGMTSIISQICLPGQSILDPFCGAGTTGIAALNHGCLFDGIDIADENVNIARGRLNDQATV